MQWHMPVLWPPCSDYIGIPNMWLSLESTLLQTCEKHFVCIPMKNENTFWKIETYFKMERFYFGHFQLFGSIHNHNSSDSLGRWTEMKMNRNTDSSKLVLNSDGGFSLRKESWEQALDKWFGASHHSELDNGPIYRNSAKLGLADQDQ